MKKITVRLLVLMLIGITLFVSCSNEPKSIDEGVGSVKFIGSDSASTSRGLTRTNPKFDAGSMVWMYEAKKTDTSGLKTGETSRKTLVGSDGKITNEVGPFSQGIWEFTLYAYESMTNANADKYAYKGVASNVKITSGSTNSVRVTVDAQQNGTGFIEVASNITLQDANGNSISEHNEKIILTNLANSNDTHEYINSSVRSFEVSSGAWKVNVIFYDTLNPEIKYGDNVIYVNVYDNLTTKVGGSLDEITASTKFVTDSGVTTAISEPATIDNQSEKSLSVSSTPVAVQDTENNTTVKIPANATVSGDAVLSVTPYVAKDAEPRFSVQVAQEENNMSAIAGLDITVAINDVQVTSFNEPITITTYIAKGIDGTVGVKYNGEGDQPKNVTYNKDTGALSFTTTHLSEYYVVADIAAINTTSNTAYATLTEAVSKSSEGDTILMLKDFANTDYSNAVNLGLEKNAVLDGNGHNIEGNVSVYVNAGGGTVKNVVFKNIHDQTPKAGESWGINGKTGSRSAIYGSGLTGKMVVDNCVFDTVDWEGIQITPKTDSADIQITGNTFSFTVDEENGIKDPLRYIHIQSLSSGVAFRAVIRNNYLFDCSVLYQTGLELYYPSDLSKIDVSDNYIDNPVAVCIVDSNQMECPELALPFSEGPNGEIAFDAVCWTYDNWGNQIFYSSLQDALKEGNKKVKVLKDIDLNNTNWDSPAIEIKAELIIDGNNKSINNLTSTTNQYGGLIGKLNTNNNVEIKNLNLNNVTLTGTNVDGECAGGALIGWMDCHGGTVDVNNVTVNGVSIDGFKYSGGLIGYKNTDTPLNITGCSVNGTDPKKTINSSYNEDGNYKGHIGGLVGYYGNGNIINCTLSNIDITRSGGAQSDRAGVLVGTKELSASITSATIENVKLLGKPVTLDSNMVGPGASTGTVGTITVK